MKESLRMRLGFWLERFPLLRPLLLVYEGEAPTGRRYLNRVNGHVVVIRADGSLS